jgi:hypothetical protein
MTDFPITPPPELVQQWEADATISREAASSWTAAFATRAAQWGADMELEACCAWIRGRSWDLAPDELRAARRPKPPSLKEQALKELQMAYDTSDISMVHLDTIRRALNQLPDS